MSTRTPDPAPSDPPGTDSPGPPPPSPGAAATRPGAPGLPVNWSLAARTGARLVRPGPAVTRDEATAEVARLHRGARAGEDHVRRLTGLATDRALPDALVVDRPTWISSAVGGMAALTADVPAPRPGHRRRRPSAAAATATATAATATAAGLQLGSLLAVLAARVLGQYDPFAGPDGEGALLLVAPNVAAARTALDVDTEDFALWVCLHEATHRVQFTAVPWLRGHFRAEVTAFAAGMSEQLGAEHAGGPDGRVVRERLPEALRALRSGGQLSLLEALQGPEQQAVLDRLIALATLLEGHAEHVMDEVGPAVVPSVATIRERFSARRRGGSLLDRALRTLLGLDAKVRQYEQGRVFVDTVVERLGMGGFNTVWTSPDTLPLRAEITDPQAWIRRVHG